MADELVVIRGGGDLASGIAHRLWQSHFKIVILEHPRPTVVRRTVSFAEAVFAGTAVVEGVSARLVGGVGEATVCLASGELPVMVDPEGQSLPALAPLVLVDAIMAKRNMGTSPDQAPIVIGVGPGFCAGRDVHAVVETQRGADLGRVYLEGEAAANTGIPGDVGGYTTQRLLRSPAAGTFHPVRSIGDQVQAGEVVALVGAELVRTQIDGLLRGLLRDGLCVTSGMKVGDVDPRADRTLCRRISDKARAVGGGVLEAVLYFYRAPGFRRLEEEAKG